MEKDRGCFQFFMQEKQITEDQGNLIQKLCTLCVIGLNVGR